MNKFEQASSDGHQMSLVGVCGWGGGPALMSRGFHPLVSYLVRDRAGQGVCVQ